VRILLTILLTLGAFLASTGCHADPGHVRIAIFRGEELTPLAQALGHFRAQQLDVEIHEVPSSSKAMEALFGGSVEIVAGGYDHAIRLAAEGRQARSFTVMTMRSPLGLVASPKATRIRAISDLKGAKVGISAFGSSGHHFVHLLLHRHGLKPSDVQMVATGGGHKVTVASAEQGRVDAIVTLPVSQAVLRSRHAALTILANGQTPDGTKEIFGVEEYPAICLMAEIPWLEAHPDTARRMARAMLHTLEWARTHTPEEFQGKLGRTSGGAEEREGLRVTIELCSRDGRMPLRGPEAVRDAVAVSYPRVRQVDVARTFTDEFVGGK